MKKPSPILVTAAVALVALFAVRALDRYDGVQKRSPSPQENALPANATSAKVSPDADAASPKTIAPRPQLSITLGPAPAKRVPPPGETEEGMERLRPPFDIATQAGPEGEAEDSEHVRRRMDWFLYQRAYPLGHIPPGARLNSIKQLETMIETQTRLGILQPKSQQEQPTIGFPGPTTWTLIGPQNETGLGVNFGNPFSTGRTVALAIHPSAPNTVLLGGAAGGVWRTTDGGTNWANLNFDQQPSLAIGGIAIAPSDANTIYVGTGENHFAFDNYYGAGVLKSIDGGATWNQFCGGPLVNFCVPTGPGRLSGGFFVGSVAVHPANPNIVLVAARNSSSNAVSGIYRSADGGANFALVASASGAPGNSVVFDPTNGNIAYAALGGFAGGAAAFGVYKSIDAGVTFTKLTGTLPNLPTTDIARTDLAISPSSSATVYGVISNASGGGARGFIRTTDAGATWTFTATGVLPSFPNFCAGQCFYDMAIIVHPTQPNTVFIGGSAFTNNSSTVFRTIDGGATWTDITTGSSAVRPHVDTHAFAFTPTGRMFIGTDGGVWSSNNPTATPPLWETANNSNLALAQFYPNHMPHPEDENLVFGGTQDNGWLRYTGNINWQGVTCGDGAWVAIDQSIPTTVYANCQVIDIRRSMFGGSSGTFVQVRNEIGTSGDPVLFIPPMVHDPGITGRVYFGTNRVWQTMNYGNNWTAISPNLAGAGVLTTMAVMPGNSNVVYTGSSTGLVQRTTNASAGAAATWSNLTTSDLPTRYITSVAVDPSDATGNTAYVGFSGFSGGADTKGHIFKTINGGASWVDISGTGPGALPNTPVNDIVLDRETSPTFNAIYIATDIGVFQSTDDGTTWTSLNPSNSLPMVPVTSLELRRRSRVLHAATHGRSAWILQLTNISPTGLLLLTSISPSSAVSSSGSVNVALDGNDFGVPAGTPEVRVDGSTAGVSNVVVVNANQITATFDATITGTPGVKEVQVFQPGHAATPANPTDHLLFVVTRSAPTITNLSPSSTPAGGSAFDLTVSGTNFVCATGNPGPSVVRFRSANLTPNAGTCTSTSMVVTVPASEIAIGGAVPVTVFSPPPGGGTSNASNFTVAGTPPINDNFAAALNATPTPFTDTRDTTSATTQAGEPAVPAACSAGFGPNTFSIWYSFTPPSNGTITATTAGSSYDTILQAVTGSLGAFTPIACNDDVNFPSDLTSSVTFAANAGTQYFFMVRDFDFGGTGGLSVFNLSFAGAAAPAVTLNPTSLAFSNQLVSTTSATQNVQVTNSGTATLNISAITKTGTDPTQFNLVAPTGGASPACSLTGATAVSAGNSCFFGVNFAPTTVGAKSANASIASNASGSPHTVPLTGTGVAPAVGLVPTTVAFGDQPVSSTSATTNIQVSNTGGSTLNISGITKTGTDPTQFNLVAPIGGASPACSLVGATAVPAAASCFFGVNFAPTSTGTKNANASIASDASGSPHTVPLTGNGIAATITLTPNPVPFGDQRVGTTSAPQTVTVTNNGTASANITSITLTGPDAAHFNLVAPGSGTPCLPGVTSLAPNNSCTIGANFGPTTTGAKNASISVASDASGSPHATALTGNGTQSQATPTPANVDFGDQVITTTSAPRTITVTNGGTATLNIATVVLGGVDAAQFAIVAATTTCNNGTVVNPGANCVINATFTPATTGAKNATITLTDDAPDSPQTILLTGNGVPPPPEVSLNPNSLSFGNQRVGTTSAPQGVTVTNTGGSNLVFSSITVTGANPGDFAIAAGTTCSTSSPVAPTASCLINTTFGPTAAGPRAGNISIASNATGSPHMVPLTGTGTQPAVMLNPTSLTFPPQAVGTTSAAMTVTLTNSGTDTLNIATQAITGANAGDFAFAAGTTCAPGTPVLAGANCLMNVTFTPSAIGTRTAAISITDDAPGSPHTVALSGSTPPAVTLSSASLAFGNQQVGAASATQNVTLTNSGGSPLTINSITRGGANAGDFTSSDACPDPPATLAAGANCAITGGFQPTAIGPRSASISITSNAPSSPDTVNLTGNGIDYAIAAAMNTATIPAGQSANFTINLTTSGGAGLQSAVNYSAMGLPAASTGSFNPTSTAAGSTTGSTTFTVMTTARSVMPPPPTNFPSQGLRVQVLFALLLLMTLSAWLMRRRMPQRKLLGASALLILALGSVAVLAGCNGGQAGTPAGTSTITVTATSGSVTRTTTVTLTVQ